MSKISGWIYWMKVCGYSNVIDRSAQLGNMNKFQNISVVNGRSKM